MVFIYSLWQLPPQNCSTRRQSVCNCYQKIDPWPNSFLSIFQISSWFYSKFSKEIHMNIVEKVAMSDPNASTPSICILLNLSPYSVCFFSSLIIKVSFALIVQILLILDGKFTSPPPPPHTHTEKHTWNRDKKSKHTQRMI